MHKPVCQQPRPDEGDSCDQNGPKSLVDVEFTHSASPKPTHAFLTSYHGEEGPASKGGGADLHPGRTGQGYCSDADFCGPGFDSSGKFFSMLTPYSGLNTPW